MTSTVRLSLAPSLVRLGMALLLPLILAGVVQAQSADGSGPTFADVPEDIQIRPVFKSSGNYNMVGTPEMPVIVAVVLTNKTEEARTVFVTRYKNIEEDKPLDFPYGCAVRITDAKGTPLLEDKNHPDGYWSSLTTDAKDDVIFRKDSRNRFEVPPKERRAFSINIATLLAGGTGSAWPVVDGKFIPGAYRFKFRWAGKESQEFSLTVMPK